MTGPLAPTLRRWLADGTPTARITVLRAWGSTPREAGAAMLVTPAEVLGTIGGGRLEFDAVEKARALLASRETSLQWDVPLGPDIGQCCGGRVTLMSERADGRVLDEIEAAEQAPLPLVLLFGAGHVGRALARSLALLPVRVRWIDHRPDEFGPPVGGHVEPVVSADREREVGEAPAGAACVVMTHSHALDSMIVAAALERGDFAYVGLIGSVTKRRRFERAFRDIGLPEARIRSLVCPIGERGIRDKRPEIIAALTSAEIVERLAKRPGSGRFSERPIGETEHGQGRRGRLTQSA